MFNRFYKIAVGIPAVLFLLAGPAARAASVKAAASAGEAVQLLIDDDGDGLFEPFFIQGSGYSPVPIGRSGVQWGLTNIFDDEEILRRDFQFLQDMHANTIRLWKADNTNNISNEFPNYLTSRTLDLAREYELKVIPGFWIEMGGYWQCGDSGREFVWDDGFFDLENKRVWPSVKEDILKRWQAFVTAFKDHPAILFWVIGNENNLRLGKDPALVNAFYALVNEMAAAAHAIDANHPVAFVNGGIEVPVISGNVETNAFGQIISTVAPAVDIWGVNAYPGNSFGDLFETFHEISGGKPLWISEFGIDAWYSDREDAEGGYEDQDTQAAWAGILWDEIAAAKDFGVIGATAMEYADEWWKPYQWMCQVPGWTQWWRPWWELDNDAGESYPCGVFNDSHDLYGVPPQDSNCDGEDDWFPATPDQFFNEEWWGIMAVEKNLTTGEPDVMIPRKVYGVLQEKFLAGLANQAPVLEVIGPQTALVGRAFFLTITASDVNEDALTMTVVQDSGALISELGASFTQHSSQEGLLSWTPTSDQLGKTFTLVATVVDEEGLTDQETFRMTVALPLPVVTTIGPAEGKAGTQVTIQGNYFGAFLSDAHYSPLADFNHDGTINTVDFKIFYASYRLKKGDAGFNVLADFNADGVVNATDLNIFVSHYRSSANGTYVSFSPIEGPSAEIVSWSDTTIVCVVPPQARSGPLKVHTPYGVSEEVPFTVTGFPMITQILPSPASREATVEITGAWFGTYTMVGNYNPVFDLDHDGDVDYSDFQQWYVSYKTVVGQDRYQAVHDFNHDGAINSVDLNLFVKGYRSSRGTSFVRFGGGVEGKVISWTSTRIVCQVPYFAVSGDVKVVTDGVESGGWPLTVQ